MPFYETIFIARQDVSSAQVEALTDTLANLVTEHGGKVTKREYWGLRNLAYRIKKNRKGHYVLRNLTVHVEALEEGPSAMMQARSRGEERERERGRRFERESERAPSPPETESAGEAP